MNPNDESVKLASHIYNAIATYGHTLQYAAEMVAAHDAEVEERVRRDFAEVVRQVPHIYFANGLNYCHFERTGESDPRCLRCNLDRALASQPAKNVIQSAAEGSDKRIGDNPQ